MRSRLLRLTCLLLPAAAVLVAGPARAAVAPDYVALGDSYSSGVGAWPYDPHSGLCLRSPHGYPAQWARANRVSSFRFAACGAATTDDVRAKQLSALDAQTDLVTITIGGNDAGFAQTVLACVFGSDEACLGALDRGRRYATAELPGRLDGIYADIRRRAPAARVVVLGYPRLVETGPCPFGMSLTKRRALNEGADLLATVISARARAAGFRYADTRARFAGHGICSWQPWINDFSVLSLAESFHPNRAGYQSGYLPALNAVLR